MKPRRSKALRENRPKEKKMIIFSCQNDFSNTHTSSLGLASLVAQTSGQLDRTSDQISAKSTPTIQLVSGDHFDIEDRLSTQFVVQIWR